jgi:hypothetical protein
MVPHAAGGTFGPNIFPQDLNRGWSTEGRRYRALEREITKTPGTFFFCCLLYADDTDFPAAVKLGVLRPNGYTSSSSEIASTSEDAPIGMEPTAYAVWPNRPVPAPVVTQRLPMGCHGSYAYRPQQRPATCSSSGQASVAYGRRRAM